MPANPTPICCTKCGLLKQHDEMRRDKRRASGLGSQCRDCFKAYKKEWLATQRGRQSTVEAKRRYDSSERRRSKKVEPQEVVKVRARRAVREAVWDGRMVKPSSCSKCTVGVARPHDLSFHHTNGYQGPNRFVGVWLCGACHSKAHSVAS